MKGKKLWFSMLLVGMSLGTAWAIRGQFGHEQGAAWAGAIGSLSVLLVSKRKDWLSKAFSVTLAGGVGWGLGGMMSYGMVVGYGRASDFGNVFYGLLMLFVIGGLYGFIGGGFFGFALLNPKKTEVKWPTLIVEMVVGALVFYFFMIEQFGWNMTPPRSELWAACFGMGAALMAHLLRNRQYAPLRVAVFAGLGGGFGFAFGNFLHVLGAVSEIDFNFWNVMEYSLGFFGGLGLSYGAFTAKWESNEEEEPDNTQPLSLLGMSLLIPLIVWQQSFTLERINSMLEKTSFSNANFGFNLTLWLSLALILFFSWYCFKRIKALNTGKLTYADIKIFFVGLFGIYMIFSWLITGAFFSTYRIEQYLYLINFVLIVVFINRAEVPFIPTEMNVKTWLTGLVGLVLLLAIFAFAAINSHDELENAKKRFETTEASK
ncbi:photosystem II biosynthesis protein [uncultured Arcticibacterium sp.]|uniref:photosystem II biosynthesis protein n=1 Tax=uncultured Arcticibacterium sp. TaxID=2173042 RepID=UPI0030FB67AF